MSTLAWLALLAGGLLIRQVAIGRAKNTPDDLKALFTAYLSADSEGIKNVTSQRGHNVTIGDAATEVTPESGGSGTPPPAGSPALVSTCVALGSSARGYRLGATGPDYYDCSGLLWRAVQKRKMYSGSRFTTSTFPRIAEGWAVKVTKPQPGDIVLWQGHHMGVYVAEDKMYSARSPAKGIGYSSISGDSGYFGSQPTYWRA